MPKQTPSLPDPAALRAEYEAGASFKTLCGKYHAKHKLVRETILAAGGTIRPSGQKASFFGMPPERRKALVTSMVEAGASCAEVSAALGMSRPQSACAEIRRLGLTLARKKGIQPKEKSDASRS